MAVTIDIVRYATTGGQRIGGVVKTYSSGSRRTIDESIPNGDDNLVALTIDVSQIQAMIISAPGALLLEWNDIAGAQGSLSIVADVPHIWTTDDVAALKLLDADVTALYVTNATGSAVQLKMEIVFDPTV